MNSDVPVTWANMSSNPYNQDPSATCLPCKSAYVPGHPACTACPDNANMGMRRTMRDAGPPCCVTEKYGYNSQKWPWEWADGSSTPHTQMEPELWQDLYAVKDRVRTGFPYNPIFNPYVL